MTLAIRSFLIISFISVMIFTESARAQDQGVVDLQTAVAEGATRSKAALFLDVQGCGLSYTAASGTADRKTKIPAEIDMMLRLGSIGKLYTATVIHRLAQRGVLDLDLPASRYLGSEDASGVANRDATLRQLLNHTGGIADYYSSPAIRRWNWREPLTPVRIMNLIRGQAATGAPGAAYSYSNSGYHLLAMVAERATKQPFADLVQAEVIAPMALRNTRYNVVAPGGPLHGYAGGKDWWQSAENTGPDSGITATLPDVRRFLQALFIELGPMRLAGQAMTEHPVETGKARQQAGPGAELRTSREGLRLIGHTGNVEGYLSFAYFAPDYGLTMIGHMTASDKETFSRLLGNVAQTVTAVCTKASAKQ
jgi:D-alanyl-D-alanine carboxypeptidase